jgi:hypothetical protein
MNFTRLNLSESNYQRVRSLPVEVVEEKSPAPKVYNWRQDIQEEHPYVEVFPPKGGQKTSVTPKKKDKKVKTNLL